MIEIDGIETLDTRVSALEQSLGGAGAMAGTFNAEMDKMRATISGTGREVDILSKGISRGLKRALEDLVFQGDSLSDVLSNLGDHIVRTTYRAGITPVTDHVGGLLGSGIESLIQGVLPFANGGAFSGGRVQAFASGGIVSSPTYFPMRGGTGLMGEAGPEAILPLARGADGRLGVQSSGGGRAVNVVMNIQTPDAEGFRRSQGQIASQMNRALSRANRNS